MKIGILLFPNTTQLDLTGPQEVLARIPGAQIQLVSEALDAVRCDNGLRILPDTRRDDCTDLEMLLIPGGAGVNDIIKDDKWLDFIATQGAKARFVTSVCTGSLALGAAGLLRGYKATTHWLYVDLLKEFGALAAPGRVVVDRNRITGGGVTAGIDFALRIVVETAGEEAAKTIQLALEYDPSPPFIGGHPRCAEPSLVQRLAETAEEKGYFKMRQEIVRDAVTRRKLMLNERPE